MADAQENLQAIASGRHRTLKQVTSSDRSVPKAEYIACGFTKNESQKEKTLRLLPLVALHRLQHPLRDDDKRVGHHASIPDLCKNSAYFEGDAVTSKSNEGFETKSNRKFQITQHGLLLETQRRLEQMKRMLSDATNDDDFLSIIRTCEAALGQLHRGTDARKAATAFVDDWNGLVDCTVSYASSRGDSLWFPVAQWVTGSPPMFRGSDPSEPDQQLLRDSFFPCKSSTHVAVNFPLSDDLPVGAFFGLALNALKRCAESEAVDAMLEDTSQTFMHAKAYFQLWLLRRRLRLDMSSYEVDNLVDTRKGEFQNKIMQVGNKVYFKGVGDNLNEHVFSKEITESDSTLFFVQRNPSSGAYERVKVTLTQGGVDNKNVKPDARIYIPSGVVVDGVYREGKLPTMEEIEDAFNSARAVDPDFVCGVRNPPRS